MDKTPLHPKPEDFEDFFENSLCGYLILDKDGYIIRANSRFAGWTGETPDELKGTRFSDHLPVGAKIYYETHLSPLLRLQGSFEEVALNLISKSAQPISVLVNAYERRNAEGKPEFIRLTVYKATERRIYENNLRSAKDSVQGLLNEEKNTALLREQFIAVLGHDLRNPLGAIMSGASILAMSNLNARESSIVGIIRSSAARIHELIENVMDFARGRLGGGMSLISTPVNLEPILIHIVEELRTVWLKRQIITEVTIPPLIECDAARISQLLSNLLSNAITHGNPDGPVIVRAARVDDTFELSVSNTGTPIPDAALERLFQPFTREDIRPSQNGLGLGLYIASEIARAHKGTLVATSTAAETRFTFRMPVRDI